MCNAKNFFNNIFILIPNVATGDVVLSKNFIMLNIMYKTALNFNLVVNFIKLLKPLKMVCKLKLKDYIKQYNRFIDRDIYLWNLELVLCRKPRNT